VQLDAEQRAAARAIAAELAAIARSGEVLAGSITERRTHCGRPGCRCMAEPPRPHGPYYIWTRKLRAKTVGRWLSADQAAEYRRWTDNHRRLKQLFGELEAIGEAAFQTDRPARAPHPSPLVRPSPVDKA
jgi:hypothetical protein